MKRQPRGVVTTDERVPSSKIEYFYRITLSMLIKNDFPTAKKTLRLHYKDVLCGLCCFMETTKCEPSDLATPIMFMRSTLDVPDSNLGRNINHPKGFHDFSSFPL